MSLQVNAQNYAKQWCADNGDGTYTNPIINSDFPDPDIIRVGGYLLLCIYHNVLFPWCDNLEVARLGELGILCQSSPKNSGVGAF